MTDMANSTGMMDTGRVVGQTTRPAIGEVPGRLPPPVDRSLAEGEDQQEHSDRDQHCAWNVDANPSVGAWLVGEEEHRSDDGERDDHDVDPEGPAPGIVRGQEAAHHGAEGGGDAGRRPPCREGGRSLTTLEGPGEDGEGGRQHEGCPDALDDGLAEDQLADGGRD